MLLLKLALVGIATAVGGHNRFFEMPQLLASLREASSEFAARPLKRFAAVLHVESIVLAGVLVTAAVLVSSPLPGTT
ncbi:putative copper export protein [Paraburkholderia youngii]